MAKIFKFKNGSRARDIITGLTGIIVGRTDYLTGCVHYGLAPEEIKNDGGIPEWVWLDESRIVLVEENAIKLKLKKEKPGGPCPNAPEA